MKHKRSTSENPCFVRRRELSFQTYRLLASSSRDTDLGRITGHKDVMRKVHLNYATKDSPREVRIHGFVGQSGSCAARRSRRNGENIDPV
jgi:hypothetical protein